MRGFWLLPARDLPTGRDGKIEKFHAIDLKPRKLQQEFWEIPCPKSWNSDGGPAVFEEELDGASCPINQKHSSSTGNFSLKYSPSRGSLGRKGKKIFHGCQMPAKPISNKPCTCVCLFLEFCLQDWPHAVLSDNPHGTDVIPHPLGLRAAQMLPAWIQTSCSRVSNSRDTNWGHFL